MVSRIQTQLCHDTDELQAAFGPSVAGGADAVALFALSIQPDTLTAFAKTVPAQTPVLLADCYGILGFSQRDGANIELMEAGRGEEYGGVGGDGGQGSPVFAHAPPAPRKRHSLHYGTHQRISHRRLIRLK